MRNSLKAEQRIRKKEQFHAITRRGKFMRGTYMHLWVDEKNGTSGRTERAMVGVIVNRRTDKRATRRNLWKRRIREAFRCHQEMIKPEKMVVIQSRNSSTIPSYRTIEREMLKLLGMAGALIA